MSGIFINYRHGTHSFSVAALADRLAAHFGPDQVFVDHHMQSGIRYPDELRARLKAADVLVAVIHPGWVDTFDREPPDWVRWEIGTALADGKEVVPLLLADTPPPGRAEIPDDIGELAMRQAARLRTAHLSEDVDALLARLESWLPPSRPVRPRPPVKRRRTWLRATPLAAVPVLLPPLLAAVLGDWSSYLAAGILSLFFMIATSAIFLVQLWLLPPTARLERRTGTMLYREYMRKYWVVPALMCTALAIFTIQYTIDAGPWALYFTPFVAVLAAFYIHRLVHEEIQRDEEWPPAPSPEPGHIRRAAVRLHEVLTRNQAPYRSRLHQQQVTQVYLDLAETKVALAARRDLPWRAWLTSGHSTVPIVFPVWTAGIAALIATGTLLHTSPPFALYAFDAVALVITAAVAAAVIALDRAIKRRTDSQMVDELTEWQQTLGPLVFVRAEHR
ncbi:hypothetical protein F4560_007713 [Saccharothrix ecbatanensis]|uniref:TIR domain-containing protein n=1 Tax=Saccharothrix ecbatanensis TaxID=1105145 RepID=A0A7W9HT16_9PSEU|nr:TIR domain-containing protein [Saccharothrix ecbatanensis]MBB5807945.1 hypothetical protein [Saccharothrix ecbatanensis]